MMDIAARWFSPRENRELNRASGDDRRRYFFDLWTLKESYIKWDGRGLSYPIERVCFTKACGRYVLEDGDNPDVYF